MYIRRKVFSVIKDEITGEEKRFSTSEIESFEQREFARKDYEGLNPIEKLEKRYQRGKLAKWVKDTEKSTRKATQNKDSWLYSPNKKQAEGLISEAKDRVLFIGKERLKDKGNLLAQGEKAGIVEKALGKAVKLSKKVLKK